MGREEHCKQITLACVGNARSVGGHTGFAPTHDLCVFPIYTAQAPGCSAELSKASPGLRALPRSKLLRFRFSGTPQRHRLDRAWLFCPSQVRAAQATRCLASTVPPKCGVSYHLPHPSRSISWVAAGLPVSGGPCVSSGELISGCDRPSGCQPPRIPTSLG